MNKYLKFEYWNTCDLGNIYYQGGQKFSFYLDADIAEPFHEDVEDGQENGDGEFIPTYRRQMKRYIIRTGLLSDYLIDAIQRMKLHDNIYLTHKTGEIEQIYNVDVEVEWQFEKYAWQGTVTLTFDMDESITVGACCDNLVVQTGGGEPEPDDRYWVAETGSDVSGDGTYANPWATLAYAATQATTPGDVIHVKAGTYNETQRINVAKGVSLVGDSTNIPKIISTYRDASYYAVWLADETLQNGNQSISYINFNGSNFTAYGGIMVWNRSNVDIHHCTFTNFHLWGVRFYVANSEGELSPNYATGNSFRHNTVTNCAGYSSYGFGGCGIDGQEDFYIGYNDFTQKNTPGTNGMPIKAAVNGIIRNGKIEHNNIYMNPFTSSEHWDFAIELWDCRGGVEIAYNYCEGSLDIGGRSNLRGVYAYSVWVHHNTFKQASQSLNEETRGLIVEGQTTNEYIIFEKNYVKNTCTGLSLGSTIAGTPHNNIRISYNIFESLGLADSQATNSKGWGVYWNAPASASTQTADSIIFLNNIFTAKVGTYSTMWGIQIPQVVATNIIIRNNIVLNFGYAPVYGRNNGDPGITCDILSIENNCFYGNGYSNVPRYGPDYTPTNNTTQNNIIADPTFVGGSPYSYKLQAGSPCINAGIDVGLTTFVFWFSDYDGQAVGNPPEIGAYEY